MEFWNDILRVGMSETFIQYILKTSTSIIGKLIVALLMLWIGLKLVKLIVKIIRRAFECHGIEASATSFLLSCISIGLKTALFMSCAAVLEFDLTAFLALLGSAGLAVGFALQGSLSNIAGGILILIMKPFKVGDYIKEDAKNNEGTVISIDIFYTRLKTSDNKIVLIPNGVLTNSSLTNVTNEEKRRLDLFVGIEYTEDFERVKNLLWSLLKDNDYILQDEDMLIYVDAFDDSALRVGIRAWTSMDHNWNAKCDLLEKIKVTFDENDIVMPANQLNVKIQD